MAFSDYGWIGALLLRVFRTMKCNAVIVGTSAAVGRENFERYRRLALFLSGRYPHLAFDVLVVAYKKAVVETEPV